MSLKSKTLELPQHFNSVGSLVRSSGPPADSARIDRSIFCLRTFFVSQGMTKLSVARTHFCPFKILQNFEHIYRVTHTLKAEG
jgi:hypothetical protein